MKNTRAAINEVIKVLLNASTVTSAITGVIARRRPINSTKEDIIVNALSLNFDQLQYGIVNVNIHVPNVEVTQNGVVDKNYPNYARIQALTELVLPVLKDYAGGGFYFTLQQESVIEEQYSSYANIRLEIRSKNLGGN